MSDSDISSGFIDADNQSGRQDFSDLCEIYVSASGFERLFRCRRYNRSHILKALKSEYVGNTFYEQALRKEFDIGYQLEHPHICRVLGWETISGLGHCIVMEYIDGVTLREFMQRGLLTPVLARKFVAELCSALGYLHGKQIVHRDLKPENVLVTHNGNNVKLIDFGLADCDNYDVLKIPAGTRYYIAPEALKAGQPLDLRADIYSLGIMMGEMAELLHDSRLAAVSRRCTRRRPEERYVSAQEVAKAVERKDAPTPYYRWVALAAVFLLVFMLGYIVYERSSRVSYLLPAYGNYSLPETEWSDWIVEPATDSLSVLKRQRTLEREFPLPAQKESPDYKRYQTLDFRE